MKVICWVGLCDGCFFHTDMRDNASSKKRILSKKLVTGWITCHFITNDFVLAELPPLWEKMYIIKGIEKKRKENKKKLHGFILSENMRY